jgi:hypothetical protein
MKILVATALTQGLELRSRLRRSGVPPAEDVADESLTIAQRFPVRSVIGRQLDGILLRAVWVRGIPQRRTRVSPRD